MYEVMPFIHL